MLAITDMLKKVVLTTLILGIGLVALPITTASAAGLNDEGNPPTGQPKNERLEEAWARLQQSYQRQDERLTHAAEVIDKVQTLIDKANGRGLDTSAVQAALDAFKAAIPVARTAHETAGAIVTSHAGFDANGKVTDRAQAVATVKALGQALKDDHAAMNGTGQALLDAVKAFRDANKPAQVPATATR